MGKYLEGKNSQTVGLSFATNAPLDDRTVVKTKDSLIGQDTWVKPGYLFNGLITAVQETQELYMYIGGTLSSWPSDFFEKTTATTSSASDVIISKYWKKISSSGLENLSGVFQFKGVASAINEAQDVLTTPSPLTLTHGGKTYDSVYCMATSYEFDGDLYYGWGTDTDGVLFWTAKPQVGKMVTQYVKGEAVTVTKVILKGKTYYKVEDAIPMLGDLQSWESIDGEVIYTTGEKGANAYSTSKGSPESLLGEILTETFLAYDFTQTLDKYETSLLGGGSRAVRADASTVGHVYQLGEDEYASNGTIWVKLGSPVEDWIII